MQIIDAHGRDPAALIAILQDVQAENSYLSQENLELIAKELNVAISAVFFRSAEPPDKMIQIFSRRARRELCEAISNGGSRAPAIFTKIM